jgi:hypothetical protein
MITLYSFHDFLIMPLENTTKLYHSHDKCSHYHVIMIMCHLFFSNNLTLRKKFSVCTLNLKPAASEMFIRTVNFSVLSN